MYRRLLTAAAAAMIAAFLLLVLGPMGAKPVPDPRHHIITQAG